MLIALGIAAAVFLALLLVRQLVCSRLGKIAERTATGVDDFIVGLLRAFEGEGIHLASPAPRVRVRNFRLNSP